MKLTLRRARVASVVGYFIVAYGILAYYTLDSCSQARTGRSHALTSAWFALACTAWDFVASAGAALAIGFTRKDAPGAVALLSAAVAGAGLISVPFWIYHNGRLLFENTWADVSCFFADDYGLVFLYVVAPVLTLATLVREALVIKVGKRSKQSHPQSIEAAPKI